MMFIAFQVVLFVKFGLDFLLFFWLASVSFRLYTEYKRMPDQITLGLLLFFIGLAVIQIWWLWTTIFFSTGFPTTWARFFNLIIYELLKGFILGAGLYLDYYLFRKNHS